MELYSEQVWDACGRPNIESIWRQRALVLLCLAVKNSGFDPPTAIQRLRQLWTPEQARKYGMSIGKEKISSLGVGAAHYRMLKMGTPTEWEYFGLETETYPTDAYMLFCCLATAPKLPTQETFAWLTLRTESQVLVKDWLKTLISERSWVWDGADKNASVDAEQIEIANAFTSQLITEAQASGRLPLLGNFAMTPPIGTLLDGLVESLRLSIQPSGIWCSVIHDQAKAHYSLMWWSPEGDNCQITSGDKYAWAMRILLAGVWRDATVVREAAFRDRPERQSRHPSRQGKHEKVIVLPRTIRPVNWGSDADRELIENRTTRASFSIRAHYRRLAEGWHTSEQARQAAIDHDFAIPPEGYTFVRPHMVGERDSAAPRIVCRGLLTTLTALSKLQEG